MLLPGFFHLAFDKRWKEFISMLLSDLDFIWNRYWYGFSCDHQMLCSDELNKSDGRLFQKERIDWKWRVASAFSRLINDQDSRGEAAVPCRQGRCDRSLTCIFNIRKIPNCYWRSYSDIGIERLSSLRASIFSFTVRLAWSICVINRDLSAVRVIHPRGKDVNCDVHWPNAFRAILYFRSEGGFSDVMHGRRRRRELGTFNLTHYWIDQSTLLSFVVEPTRAEGHSIIHLKLSELQLFIVDANQKSDDRLKKIAYAGMAIPNDTQTFRSFVRRIETKKTSLSVTCLFNLLYPTSARLFKTSLPDSTVDEPWIGSFTVSIDSNIASFNLHPWWNTRPDRSLHRSLSTSIQTAGISIIYHERSSVNAKKKSSFLPVDVCVLWHIKADGALSRMASNETPAESDRDITNEHFKSGVRETRVLLDSCAFVFSRSGFSRCFRQWSFSGALQIHQLYSFLLFQYKNLNR